jgi:hypothetical protein
MRSLMAAACATGVVMERASHQAKPSPRHRAKRPSQHSQDQDTGARRHLEQRGSGVNPGDAGPMVVQQDHIRLEGFGTPQRLSCVGSIANHFKARLAGQQGDQAPAKKGVIVDHQDPDA